MDTQIKNIALDHKIAALAHKLNLFEVEEILDMVIEQIPSIMHAHRVSIYLLDKEERFLIFKRHSSSKLQEHLGEKISVDSQQSLVPQALLQKQSLLIGNVGEFINQNKLLIPVSRRQRYTSGSCMLVPIKVRLPNQHEKIFGVINFAEKIDFTPFTRYDLEMATHLCEILGNAIHNALVAEKKLGGHQKELLSELNDMKEAFAKKDIHLDEAKKKQIQMMPTLPRISDYDIDVYYSPMETIGGDFYDFINISEEEVGIVVGDVSGHGIEAALVMSMAKQVLNIYSKLHHSLTDALVHANEEIFTSLRGESFIAVFLGILNKATHVLRYARAGQTYPVLYNSARQPDLSELKSNGVVLGTVRGEMLRAKIEEKHIQLVPQDVLLIYTDGAIEAPNAQGEEFGTERLMQALRAAAHGSAKEINQSLCAQIRTFAPTPQSDDITLLCLHAHQIMPSKNFDTKRFEKEMLQEAESFIISPDWGYSEDLHEEIVYLEQKIADLEDRLTASNEEKHKLETKCEELEVALDMAADDPDSLLKQLRDQLKIALQLPRDLIAENGRIHEEMEKQKKDLQALEMELDQMTAHADALKGEYHKLQQQGDQLTHIRQEYQNKFILCSQNIQKDLLEGSMHFDKKIVERFKQHDYQGVMIHLQGVLDLAFEKMDMAAILSLQQQLLNISRTFAKHFQRLLNGGEK
jgi:serine phosphatase RsbU (regulator of sigma subunit)